MMEATTQSSADALTHAMKAAAEFAGRITDLVTNVAPALTEIERLAVVFASFDDEHDTLMDQILDPIREHFAAELHRLATLIDGGVGDDAIYHRKLAEGPALTAFMAGLRGEGAAASAE
jgi:hypothetical protein